MIYQGIEHPETIVTGEISLLIVSDYDVITARQKGRWFAEQIGFGGSVPTLLSALVSELARNLLISVKRGRVVIRSIQSGLKKGIMVIASEGQQNGQDGTAAHSDAKLEQSGANSSGRGLGNNVMALYSKYASSNVCRMLLARRELADVVEIIPSANGATIVRVIKWL